MARTPIIVNRATTLITEDCIICGVVFALPEALHTQLRENRNDFWCPNGHPMVFRESNKDKRLRELEAESVRLSGLVRVEQARSRQLENDLLDKVKEAKRLARRAKAGVCPHCNRTFTNMAQHMATQHKDAA